jgi:hypothetical protein
METHVFPAEAVLHAAPGHGASCQMLLNMHQVLYAYYDGDEAAVYGKHAANLLPYVPSGG